TGGYEMVDESRYSVTLRRTFEADAADWTGEVKGLPTFFSLETVDLLVAGKTLLVFDKQNKPIAESQLTFPVSEQFTRHRSPGDVPGIERTNTLYFFDQG